MKSEINNIKKSVTFVMSVFNEEDKFKETVEKGIKILEQEIQNSTSMLNGEIAFKTQSSVKYGSSLDSKFEITIFVAIGTVMVVST